MRGTGSACVAAAVLAACLPVAVAVAGRCGAGVVVLALLALLAVGLLCVFGRWPCFRPRV